MSYIKSTLRCTDYESDEREICGSEMPADDWEEAIALLAHPDARSHCLELERLSTGYGARIYPPQTQHLRGNFSRLSGSFYGVAESPRAAVMEAVAKWNDFRAGHERARAIN